MLQNNLIENHFDEQWDDCDFELKDEDVPAGKRQSESQLFDAMNDWTMLENERTSVKSGSQFGEEPR